MSEKEVNVHKGHRQRVKARFISDGLDSFSDHNVLEMLLFYSVPQRDTNEIAHELLRKFNSLDAVFDAPIDELVQVNGIAENSAILIKMIPEIWKKYILSQKSRKFKCLDSVELAGQFVATQLLGKQSECFLVICLNPKLNLIHSEILVEGTVDRAAIDPRKVVELALRKNSSAVIIAHNHPSGLLEPSDEDIKITAAISDALKIIGIDFNDHIICFGDEYLSIAQDTDFSFLFE